MSGTARIAVIAAVTFLLPVVLITVAVGGHDSMIGGTSAGDCA